MRLGLRFVFFLGFFIFLSMTCHIGGELMGSAIVKPATVVEKEKDYIGELIECRKEERLTQLLEKYEKHYRFNGSVLVAYKGQVLVDRPIGYSDFAEKQPMTSQSHFQLASVSKQFTAAAIMLLKQQGKLEFDDEVKKHIPQWPYPGMTIRHLLSHTSGLSNYMWLVEHKWKKGHAPYNHEVVGMLIQHNMPLNFVPGRYHSYSNTGYVVLAYIVEKVSGKYFADFLDENIFKPLGMKNTFAYSQTINRKNQEKIAGYQGTRRGYRKIDETINDGCQGDKGIYSTANDLYKWDQALYAGKLISPEILDEAFTMTTLRNKRKVPYGFGFRIIEKDDQKTVYHHGLWNGFRTTLIRYVSNDCTIIVLNNTNSDAKHMIVKDIEKILLGEEDIPADELSKSALVSAEDADAEEGN